MFVKSPNGGLLLAIGLPLFAIAASVGVAIIAFTRGDPTLPDEYHWEGMQLDRDFADARRASDLDVRATLRVLPAAAACQVTLHLDGAHPETIELTFVHGTRPDLDRQVRLAAAGPVYEGRCQAMPSGHWHVELADGARSWSVRQDVSGPLDGISLSARPPGG